MAQAPHPRPLRGFPPILGTVPSGLPSARRAYGLVLPSPLDRRSGRPLGTVSSLTDAWTWPEGGFRLVIRCRTTTRVA